MSYSYRNWINGKATEGRVQCWRHDRETLSALLAICEGIPLATDRFPHRTNSQEDSELLWFDIRFTSLKCNLKLEHGLITNKTLKLDKNQPQ